MKELIIVRHAKSSWDDLRVADHDRPLNERGRRDAPVIAEWLKDHCPEPDLVIVSTAKRAQETAEAFIKEYELTEEKVIYSRELYQASVGDVVDLLGWIPTSDMKRVMIVGHNPTLTELVELFVGSAVGHLSTCSVVVVRFPKAKNWKEIERGELVSFASPKSIRS